MYLCHHPCKNQGMKEMAMKWMCLALSVGLMVGCVTTEPYKPKSDAQIKQEALDRAVEHMRSTGSTQAEIDNLVAYSKLTYAEKVKRGFSDTNTTSENFIAGVDKAFFNCDLKRTGMKIFISHEHSVKQRSELSDCLLSSSKVINEYYYRTWSLSKPSEVERTAVDETYLKWQAYTDSIYTSSSTMLQDQAALAVKDQLNRSRLALSR
jgi:hypothetical protein